LGWNVTAVDSFTDYYPEGLKRRNIAGALEHPDCVLIDGDLLDLDLTPLLEDVTIVFHLAAQPGVRASWDEFERYTISNLNATQRLLHAAAGVSLERFVMASTSSVYGDAEMLPTAEETSPCPVSPYGITKLAAEHLVRLYWRNAGLPGVCLRYFTVYGPRQRPDMAFNRLITRALLEEPFEVFGDGNQTRDFTFVEDAVAGTVAAAQCGMPGATYNIGGGTRRTLNSVFETLGELLGNPIELVHGERQRGDARNTAADIRRAERDLGYRPACDFSSGLQAQLDWQRAATPSVRSLV
jgi:UDP-glucose 4-epimerase